MQYLISIYDKVGQVYFPIQVFENYGDMLRTIRSMATDNHSVFSQYPSDYTVNFVGIFDDGQLFDSDDEFYRKYSFSSLKFQDVIDILNTIARSNNIDLSKVDGPSFMKAVHQFRSCSSSTSDYKDCYSECEYPVCSPVPQSDC